MAGLDSQPQEGEVALWEVCKKCNLNKRNK